jgi:hypothetical protein
MQKIFKSSDFAILIPFVLFGIWSVFSLRDYHKIDKNKIPAFIIQEGKLSKQQIADLTKLSDAKNIWVINDNKDFNRATELVKQSADAISYANQVGRLDLVSIMLGVIGIILGLAGIVGFLHIETLVKAQLNQAIKKEFEEGGSGRAMLQKEAYRVANEMINTMKPRDDKEDEELINKTRIYYKELFNKTRIDNK